MAPTSRSKAATTAAASTTLAAAAAAYATTGTPVFPCVPHAKRPTTAQGFKAATADAAQIREWWERTPGANVATPTGAPSGRFVLDIDGEQGAQSLAALEAQHGPLPATPRVTTPRGLHVHFADPGDLRNTAGKIADGVDTRADGGYVLVPPSRTADGSYEWVNGDLPLAAPPAWLLDRLAATNGDRAARNGATAGNGDGDAIREGRRNPELASIAGTMRHRGLDTAAIAAALHATNSTRCTPPLPGGEVDAIASSIGRYEPENRAPDGLAEIIANRRPLRDVTADGLDALETANVPPVLFTRTGAPARVRRDEDHRPFVEQLSEAALRGALARAANFGSVSEKGHTHVAPPLEVVRDLLALGTWPFPPLRGLIEAPALRPDGTIIDTPGYDPATGLLYAPPLHAPPVQVPVTPTPEQRQQAQALLDEALEDFPFADAASRAGALALLLTPVVRPAIDGQVPLALADAPKAGSGKGLLVSLAALIATGRPAAMLAAPTREDEWAKTLLSVLMAGASFVVLDEAGELRSPALAATLTAATFEGRILGRSENVQLPQRATWAAAGNNIRLGGDLARRCYWIRLDAKTARPWQREGFRHPDLLTWATTRRGDLLGSLLTLARAWYADGRPPAPNTPTMGGFTAWSDTVGGILHHADTTDFLANLTDLYDQADEEAVAWETFLRAWQGAYGTTPVTAAELVQHAGQDDDLRAALPDDLAIALEKSPANLRGRLGRALSKRAGTRYADDGLRVERAGQDARSRTASWRAVRDQP